MLIVIGPLGWHGMETADTDLWQLCALASIPIAIIEWITWKLR